MRGGLLLARILSTLALHSVANLTPIWHRIGAPFAPTIYLSPPWHRTGTELAQSTSRGIPVAELAPDWRQSGALGFGKQTYLPLSLHSCVYPRQIVCISVFLRPFELMTIRHSI